MPFSSFLCPERQKGEHLSHAHDGLHTMGLHPQTPNQGETASARREHSLLCPPCPTALHLHPGVGSQLGHPKVQPAGDGAAQPGYGQAQGCSKNSKKWTELPTALV